jgi:hypothetical protein
VHPERALAKEETPNQQGARGRDSWMRSAITCSIDVMMANEPSLIHIYIYTC